MKVYNPDFKSRVEKYLQRQEFMKHIGFNLDVIEAGRTEGKLTLEKKIFSKKGMPMGDW